MQYASQDWYAFWPQEVPAPVVRRTGRPVPNASAVNWPSAQFAPEFLPPGSGSVQPYSYLRAGHPQAVRLRRVVPPALTDVSPSTPLPAADTARLPLEASMPTPVVRQGCIATNIPIPSGPPGADTWVPPKGKATGLGGLALYNGLALQNSGWTRNQKIAAGVVGLGVLWYLATR